MLGTDGEAAGTDPGGSKDKVGTGPIRLNQSRSVHHQIVRQAGAYLTASSETDLIFILLGIRGMDLVQN